MAEHSDLSQFVIDLENGNEAFDLVPEKDILSGKERYDPCDICLDLQEQLFIDNNFSCGQIVCTHNDPVDFCLGSTSETSHKQGNAKRKSTIDLTSSTPPRKQKRQQAMTNLLTPLTTKTTPTLCITETPSTGSLIRRLKRPSAPCGTLPALDTSSNASNTKRAKLSPQQLITESAATSTWDTTPITLSDHLMVFKDGGDGVGQQVVWKSTSMIDAKENMFQYGITPLKLVQRSKEGSTVILWQNYTPNSCRTL